MLRQLRAGYDQRPGYFPHSVVLCGLRDVRDCRIHSRAADRLVHGGSAFNIKSKSLRRGDFTEEEAQALLARHTAATGQTFTNDAVRSIWTRTAGRPWLVDALGREARFERDAGQDRSQPIREQDVLEAQEALVLRRDTHTDDPANKLAEERVRRVVEPISGATEDVAYARDLGLVAQDDGGTPRIANPIYGRLCRGI